MILKKPFPDSQWLILMIDKLFLACPPAIAVKARKYSVLYWRYDYYNPQYLFVFFWYPQVLLWFPWWCYRWDKEGNKCGESACNANSLPWSILSNAVTCISRAREVRCQQGLQVVHKQRLIKPTSERLLQTQDWLQKWWLCYQYLLFYFSNHSVTI